MASTAYSFLFMKPLSYSKLLKESNLLKKKIWLEKIFYSKHPCSNFSNKKYNSQIRKLKRKLFSKRGKRLDGSRDPMEKVK